MLFGIAAGAVTGIFLLAFFARKSERTWVGFFGTLQFTRFLRSLRLLDSTALLPACRLLLENGRMLAMVLHRIIKAQKTLCRLPKDEKSETRLNTLAHTITASQHPPTEETVARAASALSPLTIGECRALPDAVLSIYAVRLLSLLPELGRQQAQMRTAGGFLPESRATATAFVQKHRHEPEFLCRVDFALRARGHKDAAAFTEAAMKSAGIDVCALEENLQREQEKLAQEVERLTKGLLKDIRCGESIWQLCPSYRLLMEDDTCQRMTDASVQMYLTQVERLAHISGQAEEDIVRRCFMLSSMQKSAPANHVGYYLSASGAGELLAPYQKSKKYVYLQQNAVWFYTGFLLLCAGLLAAAGVVFRMPWPFVLLLILSGSASSHYAAQHLTSFFFPSRLLPRMRLEKLPPTLCAVPTLLVSPTQAVQMARHLLALYAANPGMDYILLGDFGDASLPEMPEDKLIITAASAAFAELEKQHPGHFFYLQRQRALCEADQVYMGRERKRGWMETLNCLLSGLPTDDTFAFASREPAFLENRYRYVLALDADTVLTPEAAQDLLGAMCHPLLTGGPAILQPAMALLPNRGRTLFSLLAFGRGGMDPYHTAVHEMYGELTGRSSFLGKGLYDPALFISRTAGKIPTGSILSHDLLEGELAGCAWIGDCVLLEDVPGTLHAYFRRAHRWARGDWQLLPQLFAPSLDFFSKLKIADNLRRSLVAAGLLALLIYCVAVNRPLLLLFCLLLAYPHAHHSLGACFLSLSLLPTDACTQLDAVFRALYRLFISRKHLLAWTTAYQAEEERSVFLPFQLAFGTLALFSSFLSGICVPGVLIGLFFFLPVIFQGKLNEKRTEKAPLAATEKQDLTEMARATFSFFETYVNETTGFLPPDNVQLLPDKGTVMRTSPTNIGLYLLSLLGAEKLELLSPEALIIQMEKTLSGVEALPRWEGLFYNWYHLPDFGVLPPSFLSAVDNGNIAVCLLTCAQWIRQMARRERREEWLALSARLDDIVHSMHLGNLYDEKKDLFFIGLDGETHAPTQGHYDLLASESRLLSLSAVITGCVPAAHLASLGRPLLPDGAMASWSGTVFEYMMPCLLALPMPGTTLYNACRRATRLQKKHEKKGMWGVSESGYYAFDPALYYQYRAFGLPELSLSRQENPQAFAPYACALCLPFDRAGALLGLNAFRKAGAYGRFGFYEAVDFDITRREKGREYQVVRSHMAHHQGMLFCALVNALTDHALSACFASLPGAEACLLLLNERRAGKKLFLPSLSPIFLPPPPVPLPPHRARKLSIPPEVNVLSAAGTTCLQDARGGGLLMKKGWLASPFGFTCTEISGLRLYVKDTALERFWLPDDPLRQGDTLFYEGKSVFLDKRSQTETTLTIFVDPVTGALMHLLEITNRRPEDRLMEAASFLPVGLIPEAWQDHLSFHRLFVRADAPLDTCLAFTRQGKPDAPRLFHSVCCDAPLLRLVAETDRSAFLGRNHSITSPLAMEQNMSSVSSAVRQTDDACASLRAQFILGGYSRVRLLYATDLLFPGEDENKWMQKYAAPDAFTLSLAQTHARVTRAFYGVDDTLALSMGPLSSHLFLHGQAAGAPCPLPAKELGRFGFTDRQPILTLCLTRYGGLQLLEELLHLHACLHECGLWFQLAVCYEDALNNAVAAKLSASPLSGLISKPSGLFQLPQSSLLADQFTLLKCASALVLTDESVNLACRLESLRRGSTPLYADWPKRAFTFPCEPFEKEELDSYNGLGGFEKDTGAYILRLPAGITPPAPFTNVLASHQAGSLVTDSGDVLSYARNSRLGRLTPWGFDPLRFVPTWVLYIRDEMTGQVFTPTPMPLGQATAFRIRIYPGETCWQGHGCGLDTTLTAYTKEALLLRTLRLENAGRNMRKLSIFAAVVFKLDEGNLTFANASGGFVRGVCPGIPGEVLFSCTDTCEALSFTPVGFFGLWGTVPECLKSPMLLPDVPGNVGVLHRELLLAPGDSASMTFSLTFGRSEAENLTAWQAFLQSDNPLHEVRTAWVQRLSTLQTDTQSKALDRMMNVFLPCQVIASRLFARAGFYQAGGAYGYRDQLQDMLSLLYSRPEEVRAFLLQSAARQFEEGDVLHWYHLPFTGVRTRITDDRLFLPYAAARYAQVTGDETIWQEEIPFLSAAPLEKGENDRYTSFEPGKNAGTLRVHCLRAVTSICLSKRNLPLMDGGDWNDSMNLVNGESVWLGMFYIKVIEMLLPFLPEKETEALIRQSRLVRRAIEDNCWDGDWYIRALYEDHTPIGSKNGPAPHLDSLGQSWAVFAHMKPDRCDRALDSVLFSLFDRERGIIKLLTPPFSPDAPAGYIAHYLPGIRENGGQYTHAVPWLIRALAERGRAEEAWEILEAILPENHTDTPEKMAIYKGEPYVLAADVHADGKAGWTWYTGSAAWLYVVVLETLLGFTKAGDTLTLRPIVPMRIQRFSITYHYGTATYHLLADRGTRAPTGDGQLLKTGLLPLTDDGRIHQACFPIR